MANEKIGESEVVYSRTFLISVGQDIWFEFDAGHWKNIRVRVLFVGEMDQQAAKISPSVSISGEKDHAAIAFRDWHATEWSYCEATHFGTRNDGKKLWFTAMYDTQERGAKLRRLTVQIVLGGEV